jgi:hypothetical protein
MMSFVVNSAGGVPVGAETVGTSPAFADTVGSDPVVAGVSGEFIFLTPKATRATMARPTITATKIPTLFIKFLIL